MSEFWVLQVGETPTDWVDVREYGSRDAALAQLATVAQSANAAGVQVRVVHRIVTDEVVAEVARMGWREDYRLIRREVVETELESTQ